MYQNIRTIKVGTFNLMNFMLPNKPVYGGTLCYNHKEFRRKSDWVKFMLDQIDADIIGFQELFHKEALLRVIKNNPKYRKAKVYIAEETGDQPSVALLSRYPVEKIEVFKYFPDDAVIDFNPRGGERVILPFTTFTRPVIKADILIPHYGILTVFVVHLKSKREIYYNGEDSQNPVDLARAQSRSLMLRASESVALRALVSEALEIPHRPVILCGDVNDTGNAVTSRIISGEVPQHRLQDNVKRRIWDLLLYHVKDIQARRSYQDFYYTHIHNGMYESLDHIMVSQELVTEYPKNTGRVGLVSVYNDHLKDQTYSNQGQDKCKSDHGVVVCSLELDLDRAEKFMKSNDDYTRADALRDDEDTLAALDENNISSANDPQTLPQNTSQSISEQAHDESDKPFNMANSLERWRCSHPDHQKRSNHRSSSSFNRTDRHARAFNRTHTGGIDITFQEDDSSKSLTYTSSSDRRSASTATDLSSDNPQVQLELAPPQDIESTPDTNEDEPSGRPKRKLFRIRKSLSESAYETLADDPVCRTKRPSVKDACSAPSERDKTQTSAIVGGRDSGDDWPTIPAPSQISSNRTRTRDNSVHQNDVASQSNDTKDPDSCRRRRQYPHRGPIGTLNHEDME